MAGNSLISVLADIEVFIHLVSLVPEVDAVLYQQCLSIMVVSMILELTLFVFVS